MFHASLILYNHTPHVCCAVFFCKVATDVLEEMNLKPDDVILGQGGTLELFDTVVKF